MPHIKEKQEKVLFKTFVGAIILSLTLPVGLFLPLPRVGQVNAQDMCEKPVDVVLIMDTSGSMNDGERVSKCEWSQIKPYGGGNTWFLNTKYNVSEDWCLNIRNSFDEDKPVFTLIATKYTSSANAKIVDAKNSANSFLNNFKSNDYSALVSFGDNASLQKGLSNDHNATKLSVNNLVAIGATNIGGAIETALNELNSNGRNQANKVMLLLTDGKANKPSGDGFNENPSDIQYAKNQAIIAASYNYKIFTVGLGSNSDINETMLKDIANLTNAKYYHVPNGDGLSAIYNEIAWEICQYSSLSGCKYLDKNSSGDLALATTTLSGWEIILSGPVNLSQITDESGCYSFSGLTVGDYIISEGINLDKQPFIQTFPLNSQYQVALGQNENLIGYDFANYLPICGNQVIDAGEVCDGGFQACQAGGGYQGIRPCQADCSGWGECVIGDFCGDGVKNGDEECDDGNNQDNDGCSSQCLIETEDEDPTLINYPPIITLLGANPLMVMKGSSYSDPGATATDLEDGDLTSQIKRVGEVNAFTAGTYQWTYSVHDSGGLGATTTRDVTVYHTTPTSTPQCSDGIDNDGDGKIDSQDPTCHSDKDPNNPLTYNPNKNTENEAPVITLTGSSTLTIPFGSSFVDPGATALDFEDGDITSQIVKSGDTVNTSNAGPYTIRYNVKDSQGLSAEEKTRIVIVQEQSHSGGGGGGGGGSSSGGGAVILLNESNKGQDNLPTEPIEPTEPTGTGSLSRQCPLLLTYLRKGRNNPVEEVKKLQVFLRDFEGFNLLEISGVFDDATFSAVSEFQKRYGNEVLGEWGISDSTGYVYITTKNKVNEIYCQLEIPLTDDESAIILASRQNLSNLVDANQAGDSRKEEQSQNGSTESTSSLGFTIIGNGSNKDGENEGELSNDIKPSFFASLIGAFSQKLFKNIPLWLFFGLGLGLLLILFAVYYFVWRAKKKAMLLSQLLQSIQLK